MQLTTTNQDTKKQIKIISGIDDNYKSQVKVFTEYLIRTGAGIDAESIRLFFHYLNDSGLYKPSSVNVIRQAVKKRVRQLYKKADIRVKMTIDAELKEIDEEIKPAKTNNIIYKNKIITTAEYKKLLKVCRSERQKLFIEFLFSTGCRVDELTGVLIKDCQVNNSMVYFDVTGKGNKVRTVKIKTELYDRIKAVFGSSVYLFETSTGKRYLNNYVSKQIKKIGKLINRDISAHTFRHSFITEMIRKHPDKMQAISKYVGHSSLAITLEMYNHNELTDEEINDIAA